MSIDIVDIERAASNFPEGWCEVVLSEVAEVNPETLRASIPSEFSFGYIDIAQIEGPGHCLGWSNQTFGNAPSRARRLVQAGDILVSTVRPYLRSFAQVPKAELPLVASTGFAVVRARSKANQQFLYQHILHDSFIKHLIPRMTGSNYPTVSFSDVGAYRLLLPPLDEQRRIAEVLCSVDEVIAANQAVASQARAAYQASLTDLVGNSGDQWETARLGELATFVNGRGFKPHEWADEGLPIIRIQNLNGGIDFNHYNGEFNSKILVQPGDLLFAWSGSRGTSFGPHIWRGPQGVLNYHTWKVVPKVQEDRDYLYFALRHLTKKIEDEAHGASALVHMQKAYVVDYEIELPPPEERRAIAATLIDLLEAANHANHVYTEAVAVKNYLLRDLLSGHVRTSVVATTSAKSVPPAFKRAVFAAEIVHQLHNDNRFGSVKHEKIAHLCELHLGLQADLDRHAYKEAAGPYDPKARRSVEKIFRQQKWFQAKKTDGGAIVYVPLEKAGCHSVYFDRYFGDRKLAIQAIMDLMRPLKTEQCEIVATLYAVWNDFLIDKVQPSDEQIVTSVLQWHPKKEKIAKDRWMAALPWMREKDLVPKGTGEKTRVSQG